MRLFCGAIVHETNGFSPIPTSYESFRTGLYHRPGAGITAAGANDSVEMGLAVAALARGHEVVVGLHAAAAPSAPPHAAVYERLRAELLDDLRQALPVDGVLLFLHGAQLAQGYTDCEGDLLEHVRALVGPHTPVGVEMDLHGNITPRMVANATVMNMCLEYPHTDFAPRADDVVRLIEAVRRKYIRPSMTFAPVPMLGFFHTTREPMRGFVDRAKALEGYDGILSVTIAHGFPFADIADAGAGILVVADGDPRKARDCADALAVELFAMREAIRAPMASVDEALDAALACDAWPVVIADTSDNPGGAAAGDSTYLLSAMVERRVENASLAMIYDPMAVRIAQAAGVGAIQRLRIGGKFGPDSGTPFDADAKILKLADDLVQQAFGAPHHMGPAALIEVGGVEVVLSSSREQTHSIDCFTAFGIDLRQRKILVVKSAQHFHASFEPVAARIIYATPPGATAPLFEAARYRHLTRPIWPLDVPPFTVRGRQWT